MVKQVLNRRQPHSDEMDAKEVLRFIKTVEEQGIELHTITIYKQGAIILEAAKKPYSLDIPHMSFSLAKGFIGTAIGFLYDEGRVSLETPIIDFFPEYKEATSINHMTVEHALMMCTGHEAPMFGADFRKLESDWLSAFLKIPYKQQPGEQFLYNSGTSYMLSALVQRVTGQTVVEYLQNRLFVPLDIPLPQWEESPEGINTGGWGLYLKAEDVIKLCIVYLQRGRWGSQQLLSEKWVTEATALKILIEEPLSSISSRGYGYHFWCGDEGINRVDGAYGQLSVIDHKANTIVVINGGTPHLQELRHILFTQLLPALRSNSTQQGESPLPKTEQAFNEQYDELMQYLKAWSYKPEGSVNEQSAWQNEEQQREFKVISTNTTTKAVSLTLSREEGILKFEDLRGLHEIRFGFNDYVNSTTTLSTKLHDYYDWEQCEISSFACWQSQDTLEITCRYLDKPYVDQFLITIQKSNLFIKRSVNTSSVAMKEEFITAVEA